MEDMETIAIYNYNYFDYEIVQQSIESEIAYRSRFLTSEMEKSNSLTFKIISNTEGIDYLTGVELLKFADKTIIDYSKPINGNNYLLDNVKDYDGNKHAGDTLEEAILL